jgi:hypothetical protein
MPYTGGYPEPPLKAIRGRWDFAVDAGAIGSTNMTSIQIPSGAVIVSGYVEVNTAATSGGAGTLAITVEGAGDIVAAAAVSGAPWSTTGRKSVIPVATGATSVKTTAARYIVATIAAATLTAGQVDVVLFYTI